MRRMSHKEALQRAIDTAGGQVKLAESIGTKQQNVSWWLNKTGQCPAEFALAIERVTGVPASDLRSDLYPREKTATSAA